MQDRPKMVTRALLVSAYIKPEEEDEARSLLDELEELVDTLGVPVIDKKLVHIREAHPRLYLGTGKAQELVDWVRAEKLDVIIFDNELSPAQQRNWEKLSGVAVIDRQEVILDIFGQRARTREARLQVDLARMEYSLPRLTRAWSHFGHQGGGIGGKGEGEAQLEQDKRLIRKQIETLRKELEQVRRVRATQRKTRQRTPVPNAAIVGYTNAGKSSLLRRLTEADVLVEDKLFATLDTTTRKVQLPHRQPLLLTDTVGFVRKLPHKLVEAFNATLEESVLADFLVHVVDASQPSAFDFHQTTLKVLAELGADEKRMLLVFNKIDKVGDPLVLANIKRHFPEALFISAHTGAGLDDLLHRMGGMISGNSRTLEFEIPHHLGNLVSRLHAEGNVLGTEYEGEAIRVRAVVSSRLAEQLSEFVLSPLPEKTGAKPASPAAP